MSTPLIDVLFNKLIEKIARLIATDDTGAKSKPEKHDIAKILICSFCKKSQYDVKKLIAGPDVCICDECVDLCNQILTEEQAES